MTPGSTETGWLINGFQTVVVLWAWTGLMLLHAIWRSVLHPATDPLRPSGPIG